MQVSPFLQMKKTGNHGSSHDKLFILPDNIITLSLGFCGINFPQVFFFFFLVKISSVVRLQISCSVHLLDDM